MQFTSIKYLPQAPPLPMGSSRAPASPNTGQQVPPYPTLTATLQGRPYSPYCPEEEGDTQSCSQGAVPRPQS